MSLPSELFLLLLVPLVAYGLWGPVTNRVDPKLAALPPPEAPDDVPIIAGFDADEEALDIYVPAGEAALYQVSIRETAGPARQAEIWAARRGAPEVLVARVAARGALPGMQHLRLREDPPDPRLAG